MNSIKIQRIFFVLLFFLIMSVPIFFTAFNINIFSSTDIGENRVLASKKVLQNASVSDYPKQIEKYLNDNMVFRTQIIKMYHYIFAWNLYSPVSNVIRVNDEIFNYSLIQRYLNTPLLNIDFNEILTGMDYIAKSNGVQFIYVMVPDKISYEEDNLPDWMKAFKKRHYQPSFYEQVNDAIKNHEFINIDILNIFKQKGSKLYSNRYDINHYNHYGLEISLNAIAYELASIYKDKFSLSDYLNSYSIEDKVVNTFPYISSNGKEIVPWMSFAISNNNIHVEKMPNAKKNKSLIWASTDYIINSDRPNGLNVIFASDSSFKAMRPQVGIKNRNGSVTPLVCVTNKYIHTYNNNSFNYQEMLFLKKYINADAVIYSITERQVMNITKDEIFQIAGRYALGKNENFIFPEDISNQQEEISTTDIEISKNNKYININKQLITDKNGEIYISFRYKSPEKTSAILEYSNNKDFTNKKTVSAKLNGGGYLEGVSFYIKSNPNQKIYARLIPGNIDGKYVFAEIKELREKN